MKGYDKVRIIRDNEDYAKDGVYAGDVGYIIECYIRDDNKFDVEIIDDAFFEKYKDDPNGFEEHMLEMKNCILTAIKIEDLEFVKEGFMDDKKILSALPDKDPKCWCKVEDGYILNLLGEKKNKIPYDYNS